MCVLAHGPVGVARVTDRTLFGCRASAGVAREVAEAAAGKGIRFIDGPVSGGQAGAENGKLTVMCGGEQGPFDEAQPVMDCYAQAVTLLGPVGSGQL